MLFRSTAEVPKADLGRELAEDVEDASGLQMRRSRCPRVRLEVRKVVVWRVLIAGDPPRGDGRRNRTAEVPKPDLGRELPETVGGASDLR